MVIKSAHLRDDVRRIASHVTSLPSSSSNKQTQQKIRTGLETCFVKRIGRGGGGEQLGRVFCSSERHHSNTKHCRTASVLSCPSAVLALLQSAINESIIDRPLRPSHNGGRQCVLQSTNPWRRDLLAPLVVVVLLCIQCGHRERMRRTSATWQRESACHIIIPSHHMLLLNSNSITWMRSVFLLGRRCQQVYRLCNQRFGENKDLIT